MSFQLSVYSSRRWNFSSKFWSKASLIKSLWHEVPDANAGDIDDTPFHRYHSIQKGMIRGWRFLIYFEGSTFLCLQFTQRMVVCKSELVRDGDLMYSYLFVGVGLAQKFKPITLFTRDFQLFVVHKLLFHGKFHLITSASNTFHHFSPAVEIFPFKHFLSRRFSRNFFLLVIYDFSRKRRRKLLCILLCTEYDENLCFSSFV